MGDLISRQAAYETLTEYYHHTTEIQHKALCEALAHVPTAQPTEASCWGCNCQKMERLNEQKTFSEMVHLHDAETHEERTETHACDLISRQAVIEINRSYHGQMPNEVNHRIWKEINELPSAQPENDWIPVAKKAHPDLPIRVQVQLDNGWIITAYYQEGEWLSVPDCGEPLKDEYIEAWRELPEPYAERRTDGN